MKKLFTHLTIVLILLFGSAMASMAQTTETFESATVGNSSFTSNSTFFTLLPSGSFNVNTLVGLGYLSSDKFIDNYGVPSIPLEIKSASVFTVKSLYVYPSEQGSGDYNQISGTNITFTGKLAGVIKFTYTPPSADFSAAHYSNTTNRGFSLVNFATPGYDNIPIDDLVISFGGTTVYAAIDNFTWALAPISPTVSNITPASGPLAGGTSVVITGTNLTGATAVKFGSTAAASYTVNSVTQITATSPAGVPGAVDITVTTASGTSATNVSDKFTYIAAPTVTTQAVSAITTTTATGNGNITSLGSSNPTAYGVCWNTTGTPTISDSKVDNGAIATTGAFTAAMTALSAGTTYYVRAYATNTGGTSYGTQVSFTTNAASSKVVIWKQGSSNLSTSCGTSNAGRNVGIFGNTSSTTPSYTSWGGIGDIYFQQANTGWDNGSGTKGWSITVNTLNFESLDVSFRPSSANRNAVDFGPRDFVMQYSLDNSNWTSVGATYTAQDTWSSGEYTRTLPSICDNKATVYIRWIMNSNVATDGGAIRGTDPFSALGNVTVKANVMQVAPTNISLSSNITTLNGSIGRVIGTLSTTDANECDTHTYSLVAGAGDTNNASYQIVGNQLVVNVTTLTGTTNTVRVQSNDGISDFAKSLTIDIEKYCFTNADDNYYYNLTNVTFNTINNNSTADAGGYGNYTSITTNLNRGSSYNISVTVNDAEPSSSYPYYLRAYIDWNQDGAFDGTGEAIDLNAGDFGLNTFTNPITIPAGATVGSTRMRVAVRGPYGVYPADPALFAPSCGAYDYGETEDYSLNIIAAPGEINITGGGNTIADGDATPIATDNTNYGSVDISTGNISKTYVIQNVGAGALSLTGTPIVTISGTNAADFSVATPPAALIAAGGSSNFIVTFNPSATGTRTAEISIANDDSDENPYNFSVQGTGTSIPTVQSVGVPSDGTYSVSNNLDFTINFDEPIIVTGAPYLPITLSTGGPVWAWYISGSGTNSLVFRYTVGVGEYDINGIELASAINANGGSLTSASLINANLTLNGIASTTGINVDSKEPTINFVSATTSNGTYTTADVISLTVEFSEIVNVTGTPTLSLNNGGTATYASGSGTNTLLFDYTVSAAQAVADLDYASTTALDLAGGSIKDAYLNNAVLDLPAVGAIGSLAANKNIVIGYLATVNTLAVSNITTVTATGKGNISYLGSPSPTLYGICWKQGATPSITDSKDEYTGAPALGDFTGNITGLTVGNTYHVRAYAINTLGVSYGSEVTFTAGVQLTISTPSIASKPYNGSADAVAYTTLGTVSGIVGSDDVTVNIASSVFDNKDAGTAKTVTVTYSLSGVDAGKYIVPTASIVTIGEITAKAITVTVDASQTKVYGATDPVYTYTFTPALESADSFTGALSRTAGENVSLYAINQGTLSAGSNYAISFVSKDFEITTKAITVTADAAQTKEYGTTDPTYTYTVTPALESGDSFTGSLSRAAGENVSLYAIAQGTLSAGSNYAISFVSKDFEITTKAITVTADAAQTKVYGATDPTFTYSVSPALVSGDSFTGALSRAAGENVSLYAFTQGTLSAGSNYAISFVSKDFEITTKAITVTADAAQTKVYGTTDPIFTYSVSPALVSGDSFTGALSRAAGENASLYAISQGTLSAGSNYAISFVSSDFEITAKAISVTADASQTKVYGATDPIFTYSVTPALESGDSFSGALSRAAGENVSLYAISQGTLSAGSNYAISFVSKDFEITTKAITVTADAAQTKVYGTTDPTFTYSVTPALESGDSFTGALNRAAGENVSLYSITQGTLSAGSNYAISFVSKDFEITTKAIIVTADAAQTKVYGTTDPIFTYSVSPALESGDSFNGALSRAVGENVSLYAISQGTLSAGSNYAISFVSSDFEITAKAITVTADAAQSKVYGTTDPSFTYTFTPALESADFFTGALSRATGENVSLYAITQGTLSAGSNYAISFVSNDFEITAKTITVTADAAQTKVYGDIDPTFTYTFTPALESGDSFTGALSRVVGENVGLYTITQGTLSAGSNYAISFAAKDFEITSKQLTINVPTLSVSKVYDSNNTANVTAGALINAVVGDNVSAIATAVYDNANVGTGKSITVSYTLTGTDAANYIAPVDYISTTGVIDAKQLTISSPTVTTIKMYDGNAIAGATIGNLSGVISPDDITVSISANYDDALIGDNKTILVTYSISGAASSNYITPVGSTISAAKILEEMKLVDNKIDVPAMGGCQGDQLFIAYDIKSGDPKEYQIIFSQNAIDEGFSNVVYTALASSFGKDTLFVPIPSQVKAGNYTANVRFRNEIGYESTAFAINFTINLPKTLIVTKYSNVVLCDNSANNFSTYQWYKNGQAISGATKQFYQDKAGLIGDYYVEVKTNTNASLHTCSQVLNLPTTVKTGVEVYPIPVKSSATFTVKITNVPEAELAEASLYIFSTQGAEVYSTNDVQLLNSIQLPVGDYVGVVNAKDGNKYSFKVSVVY